METRLACSKCNVSPPIGTETQIKCDCGGSCIVKGVAPCCDAEYVRQLEGIANEMRHSMENMLSLVDPKRTPVCGNIGASNQAALVLGQYHKLMQDYYND